MLQRSPNENDVLTEAEAATAFGVSKQTLGRYRREGRPLCAYFWPSPGRLGYRRCDIEAAKVARRVPSAEEAEVNAAVADVAAASNAG